MQLPERSFAEYFFELYSEKQAMYRQNRLQDTGFATEVQLQNHCIQTLLSNAQYKGDPISPGSPAGI